jgi:ATP-dependent Clp protease ATP-binding subunit ClpB
MESAQSLTLSENLKRAIRIAQALTKEYSNEKISAAHLLKALLNKEVGLTDFLISLNKDIYFMEEWADVRIESSSKTSRVDENPSGDESFSAVLREADNFRVKLSKDQVDPICALAAICTPGVGFNYEQLKSFNLKQDDIIDAVLTDSDIQSAIGTNSDETTSKTVVKSQTALLKYCIDLTENIRMGRVDPVVARDSEIRSICEILGRRSKSNVLIIGDPGVGKTALVHGFVYTLSEDIVVEALKGTSVFELDNGALIAGASYKGEVEDRLKSIIKEIQQFEKAILFIDEIHMLLDQQSGSSGAANLLKPELSRGNLTIISTSSIDNYTKVIEPDEAFTRQFELIRLEEPDDLSAFRMLQEILPGYEKHHNLLISKEVCSEAIKLAKRYLKERSLPDSAIDLIDHTMSGMKLMAETSKNTVDYLETELNKFIDLPPDDSANSELMWFKNNLTNHLSPFLTSKLYANFDSTTETGISDSTGRIIDQCKIIIARLQEIIGAKVDKVETNDLTSMVSARTGIPVGKVQTQERERLLGIEEHLKKRVVGQDHALHSVADAILESRSGLNKAGQPIGSFFFLGPTGTGKTELAKSLAEFLFQDESFLIRFDMSEFKEEHSAALLYGAPPGYVGYEEGGLLVNKIRQKPYSVLLFDEIEKAHTSVFDIFLQILDEGKLHDRLGKEGDFSNAVILFTSNIGSEFIVNSFGEGKIPASNELMDIMSSYFRPEFLGRLTEIVPFAPISSENVVKIFDIHLKSLMKSLEDKGITFTFDEKVKEKLAHMGFTPKYGARPIVGTIRNQLRKPLSKMIVSEQIRFGSTVELILGKGDELRWDIKND